MLDLGFSVQRFVVYRRYGNAQSSGIILIYLGIGYNFRVRASVRARGGLCLRLALCLWSELGLWSESGSGLR